jgi:hypothetical protein
MKANGPRLVAEQERLIRWRMRIGQDMKRGFLWSAPRVSAGVVFQPLERVAPVCSWDHPTAGCAGACADEAGTDISFLIPDPT